MMDMSRLNTNWIWLPDWRIEDDAQAQIVYFRRVFELEEVPETLDIKITADSRYKLYVNGVFLQEGPSKGDLETWYKDTACLGPYLKQGKNVLAVEVLRYPEAKAKRNNSLYRTAYPCLYVEDAADALVKLEAKDGWKVKRADKIKLAGETTRPAPLYILEQAAGDASLYGWKLPGYDDTDWLSGRSYSFLDIRQGEAPFNLVDRTIPAQRHAEKMFDETVCVRESAAQTADSLKEQWDKMLRGEGFVEIPANTTQIVELSAGELECGYPVLEVAGGAGTEFILTKAESYVYPNVEAASGMGGPQMPLKGDRTDYVKGEIIGQVDRYTVGGFGTDTMPESYESYWFRTFRYYRIEVTTREQGISIRRFTYRTTGYPLAVKTSFEVSDASFKGIWDISVRTLERCMHETYMDCPYYEQLQYAMDGRSEILFTYLTAADDRLARRCMDDFRRSQRSDGMINSNAPTIDSNVIPGFSIYYLMMVHDHMMYFGDKKLVKEHFNCIDRILQFFDDHLTEKGLVGSVGGPLMRAKYWSFIDWSDKWNHTAGVPLSCSKGDRSITMESLLYLYGLQHAAELAEYIGRGGMADEYRNRAETLKTAILEYCTGTYVTAEGTGQELIQDGPGINDYSVHSQVFAILTGVVSPEKGKKMLEVTVGNGEWPQASVSFMFYLFRALEITDWYDKADALWDIWRQMLEDQLTTCVENDTDARSDCHAWASVLLYELPAVYLGVRPAAPGFEKVSIRPKPGHLSYAKGEVMTPKGSIYVAWEKNTEGELVLSYKVPEGVQVSN